MVEEPRGVMCSEILRIRKPYKLLESGFVPDPNSTHNGFDNPNITTKPGVDVLIRRGFL